jgi:hypothetical protein
MVRVVSPDLSAGEKIPLGGKSPRLPGIALCAAHSSKGITH